MLICTLKLCPNLGKVSKTVQDTFNDQELGKTDLYYLYKKSKTPHEQDWIEMYDADKMNNQFPAYRFE